MKFFNRQTDFTQGLIDIIFKISSVTFIIFFVVEYFLPGFVTNWFNPIYLLIFAIISAIIIVRKE